MLSKLFTFFLLLLSTCSTLSKDFTYVSTTTNAPTDKTTRLDELQAKLSLLESQIATLQLEKNSDQSTFDTYSFSQHVPRNCKEVQQQGHYVSNVYYIQPRLASAPFPVLCDMKTRGGGWTYIINRFDGSEDFFVGWDHYKEGFGNLGGEFWLGLENIHLLTGYEFNELLVEIVDWDDKHVYAHYNTFTVGSEKQGYVLKMLEGYSGDAGDSMESPAGMRFTTFDKDQDLWKEGNCATFSKAGWWYRSCKRSNPTGVYYQENRNVDGYTGMYWYTYRGDMYSYKQLRMMVRPRVENKQQLKPKDKFD